MLFNPMKRQELMDTVTFQILMVLTDFGESET